MLYVRIDIAKHEHQVAIIDDEGEIHEDVLVINNTRSGFQKLDEIVHRIQVKPSQECMWAMEDTGNYHAAILKFLEDKQYKVYCYNPILVKKLFKSRDIEKNKNR